MGYKELSERENWQTDAVGKSKNAEDNLERVFFNYFKGSSYKLEMYPKELSHIYMNVELDKQMLESIYTPVKPYKRHGIVLDSKISNINTGKGLYVDCKRQDGWIEGTLPKAGRGEAHERLCKYFAPGLLNTLRKYSGIDKNYLPFWIVFQGNITRDPKRVREIHYWFDTYKDHFYLWQDITNENGIIEHFNKLKHILD